MTDFFLDHFWVGPLVWALLYISDYRCTLICARMYQAGAREKIAFEGSIEITPFYQRDIDSLRRLSPRFVLVLVLGLIVLCLPGAAGAESSPGFFSFILGALILVQLTIHVRHFRNYVLFRAMLTDAVRGRLEYSRPVLLRTSAIEIITFAGMFAVLFAFTGSPFVLGGVFACTVVAAQHYRFSNAVQLTTTVSGSDTERASGDSSAIRNRIPSRDVSNTR